MGGPIIGFAGGREDIYEPEDHINWGLENEWLGDTRYHGDGSGNGGVRHGSSLKSPFGATQMGLIYV